MAYRFSFMVYSDKPVFRLSRKIEKMVGREGRRTTETERRFITNIAAVKSRPVRCIQVNSESHLFLAGQSMIPTHNTEIINNIVGYFIDQDPSPMMVLQPTVEMAKTWSHDRLAPMVRDTPALKSLISDNKSRASSNTLFHKSFPGGHITMTGANSPAGLASRPIRVVCCDEVSRYPQSAGAEGDPVNLIRKRTTTFHNRKIVLTSTPTLKGACRIEQEFNISDRRHFHVPCPHCEHEQRLKWSNVQWPEGKPEEAVMACTECGGVIENRHKPKMIKHGRWIAELPGGKIAGFHLNELYSPWRTFAQVAEDFCEAKKNPETLKTWVNTSLGETWEESGDAINTHLLSERQENYGIDAIPADVILLTLGADIQKDRIEYSIVGWGLYQECWILDHVVLWGDPTQQKVWRELDEALTKTYDGYRIAGAAIDSGYLTEYVYQFTKPRSSRRVFAIKGVAGMGKTLTTKAKPVGRTRTPMYTVGVDTAKRTIYARLKLTSGEGYIHFGVGLDDEYFLQLTAEKMVTKYRRGFPVMEFVKMRERNEALDTLAYAYAALDNLNANLVSLGNKRKSKAQPEEAPEEVPEELSALSTPEPKPRQRRKRQRNGGAFVTRF
jgi:phage terminase large subunit GpA-like protein